MFDTTPLLNAYALWRLPQLTWENAATSQARGLLTLLRYARATKFGRAHGFDRIESVADFQARVPLRHHEEFWADYWREPFPVLRDVSWPGLIPYFALTSGTSAVSSKYLPVTEAMNRANRRSVLDVLVHHLSARPRSRIFGGKNLILDGSTDMQELAPGVFAGDLSGIIARTMPFWARERAFTLPSPTREASWESNVKAMARASLTDDIRSISGTPNALLDFFREVMALRPGEPEQLSRFYPRLELLVHGGMPYLPYRQRFAELLEGSHAEMREIYAASEGFIAAADSRPGNGLRLITDNGLFFEFVPIGELTAPAPTRHWIANAEVGQDYALVLSSNAGIWAYVLGDTVRLVERHPPRLIVTGRTSLFLSAFSEHVTAEEVEAAVAQAANATSANVAEFCVGALHAARGDGVDAHLYPIEFANQPPSESRLADFARLVDAKIVEANADYAEHRRSGQLASPRVVPVRPGTFARWMKARSRLGRHNKVPRIISDPDVFDDLRDFAERYEPS